MNFISLAQKINQKRVLVFLVPLFWASFQNSPFLYGKDPTEQQLETRARVEGIRTQIKLLKGIPQGDPNNLGADKHFQIESLEIGKKSQGGGTASNSPDLGLEPLLKPLAHQLFPRETTSNPTRGDETVEMEKNGQLISSQSLSIREKILNRINQRREKRGFFPGRRPQ